MDTESDSEFGAFGASRWLGSLPPELVATLKGTARTSSVRAGQRLSELGDTADSLIGVDDGVLAVHTDDEDQHDIIGHLFWPGDWFGVAAILIDTPRFVGTSALTDARIVQLPRRAVERIAEGQPILWRGLAMLSAVNVQLAARIARDALLRSPAERCAATLDRLVGTQPLPCDLPITQTQFADICGLSRGAVAKTLSDLERGGVVSRGYASITVHRRLGTAQARNLRR
jgi:CRP-like cAMP-binding protein